MIDRYCFVRLLPEHAHPDGRAAAIAALRAALRGLPGLGRLTLGTPADASAAKWDVSFVARFASLDALEAARASEPWRAAFETLAAGAVVIKEWSFEVTE